MKFGYTIQLETNDITYYLQTISDYKFDYVVDSVTFIKLMFFNFEGCIKPKIDSKFS